jgi:AcrR family transcriptional regulator
MLTASAPIRITAPMTTIGALPAEPTTQQRILTAARELFVKDGIRATTLPAVAERAGCSRMTVHRYFPGKATLVREVVLRDVAAEIDQFDALWGAPRPFEERVVATFVWAVETTRASPLLSTLLAAEPEALLPALTIDGETILETASVLVADRLRAEHYDEQTARTASELLCRLVLSLVLQPYGRLALPRRADLERFAAQWILPGLRLALETAPGRSATGWQP